MFQDLEEIMLAKVMPARHARSPFAYFHRVGRDRARCLRVILPNPHLSQTQTQTQTQTQAQTQTQTQTHMSWAMV